MLLLQASCKTSCRTEAQHGDRECKARRNRLDMTETFILAGTHRSIHRLEIVQLELVVSLLAVEPVGGCLSAALLTEPFEDLRSIFLDSLRAEGKVRHLRNILSPFEHVPLHDTVFVPTDHHLRDGSDHVVQPEVKVRVQAHNLRVPYIQRHTWMSARPEHHHVGPQQHLHPSEPQTTHAENALFLLLLLLAAVRFFHLEVNLARIHIMRWCS
mmetsp:Transcript_25657/g.84730  ORF Transcript_25657/g.84730 Transcript_25657/m.84730 type:complete len:213 (-) Transcript_25657:1086-1724(-)